MSLFEKRTQLYGPETVDLGEVDYTVDGFYRNIITLPVDVKRNRNLFVHMTSDKPVDVVIANDKGAALKHKERQTDITLGPVPTEKFDSMGVILGVYRGDRAKATVEIWMEKE